MPRNPDCILCKTSCVVSAVILHRHIKNKRRLSTLTDFFKLFDYLFIRIPIRNITISNQLCIFKIRHIQKRFKANFGIHLSAIISSLIVWMNCRSMIPSGFQNLCNRIRAIPCDILLIRNRSLKKCHRISCQKFILCICRSASDRIYLHITFYISR